MIFFSVLLLLTVPLYFGAILTTATLSSGEGYQGLSRSFAYILTAALWTALAAIVATVYLQQGISVPSAIAALVLVPVSGAAALASIRRRRIANEESARLLLVGWLAPLLIVAFASWTYFPTLKAVAPHSVVAVLIWPTLLLVSLSPWIRPSRHQSPSSPTVHANEPSNQTGTDPSTAARKNRRDAFLALGPHVALRKWLPYLTSGHELREEALAAIRQSPRRQADAEFLLKSGMTSLWLDVPVIDLKLTPTLADLGRKFIRERAQDIIPLHPGDAPNFEYMANRIEPYVVPIGWLVAQHCDCRTEITALADAVRLYPESAKRNSFLNALIALRPPAVIAMKPAFNAPLDQRIETPHGS